MYFRDAGNQPTLPDSPAADLLTHLQWIVTNRLLAASPRESGVLWDTHDQTAESDMSKSKAVKLAVAIGGPGAEGKLGGSGSFFNRARFVWRVHVDFYTWKNGQWGFEGASCPENRWAPVNVNV